MIRLIKGVFVFIVAVIALFSAYALITGKTYLFKAVYYNFADIDDYRIFTNDTVKTGTAQPWPLSGRYNRQDLPGGLQTLLEKINTVGLVAVKDDSILYERYWNGYSDSSWSNSFSMAKSITSLLIGVAIREGKIKSVDQLVSDFVPEMNQGLAARMRIRDLLTMSSGSNWDEAYANPFSITTEAYYGNDLHKTATGIKITREPGTYHSYHSGDTELLGLILVKATGMSLSQFASEQLWKPMGAEHPALWSTDRKGGLEKAFCCFNSNARDFARIGQLMLDSGKWKGIPIIDSGYYRRSISPCMINDEQGKPCNYYGYQWWLAPAYPGVFYARGILGQYTIVIPSKRLVIVRLGHQRSDGRVNGLPEEVDALINWGKNL
jgi:CubicO group peptidase (beta-lactamase class C family)